MLLPAYEKAFENRRGKNATPFRMVTFDPGETVGWSCFYGKELEACGQFNADHTNQLRAILKGYSPNIVVCENYRPYGHKIGANVNSELFTPRLIGRIEMMTEDAGIPLVKQMASQAKGFATDAKLTHWGFWQRGMKHSRDAIRHGLYFLFWGDFSLIDMTAVDTTMQSGLQCTPA